MPYSVSMPKTRVIARKIGAPRCSVESARILASGLSSGQNSPNLAALSENIARHMHFRRQHPASGQVLVLLVILLAIMGGGYWYMNQSKQANEKAARAFAQEAATRIVMQQDDRFLAFAIAPESQITYPPSWRYRLFSRLHDLGAPAPPIELDGRVTFTSGFFEPRGDFHAKINFPEGPAFLDLQVSHPRALWQIDAINLIWTPKVEPTPSPTPEPSLQPTPSPTPEETKKKKRPSATPP